MKKSRICRIRILFPVFAVLLFSIFLLTIKVNAASDQYYFPMPQNENHHFSGATSVIENYFDTSNNYIFVIYMYSHYASATDHFEIVSWSKSSGHALYGEIYNNAYTFGLYKIGSTTLNYQEFDVYWANGTIPSVINVNTIPESQVMSRIYDSSTYSSTRDYASNFQLYTNNTNTRKIVLLYSGEDISIPENDTIPPENTDKPDFIDYVSDWSNAPSFDSSSVEAGLNSVFSIIQWLGNNIKDTITGTCKYTVDTVLWGMQMIINNIRGKLQELKTSIDGIVSGIGDLLDSKFGNIFTIASSFISLGLDQAGNFSLTQMFTSLFVPSTQEMLDVVLSHDEFGIATFGPILITTFKTIYNQILGVSASTTFHVPSCTFHGVEIGNFDLSYAWFLPYKAYYDAIVSAFLVIGYVYWVIVSASHFLRGHVGQGSDPAPADNYAAGWHYDL